ncbi:hypothetical protein [Palleniella muris]|uniref:hypothetical protein n=1 Tax=Palleniella muris TaxID=3038145 RepID=UPI00240F2BB7|nr:hypothetical protein [Palleniella muris]
MERNITTQYYGRRLASQKENLLLPSPSIVDKYEPEEYIKNPIVAEFLGFRRYGDYAESELEQALIDNLQQFISCMRQNIWLICQLKKNFSGK